MKRLLSIILFIAISFSGFGQAKYWLFFADKEQSAAKFAAENVLSERAIQRRIKQGIPLDQSDLPVSKIYIDQVKQYQVSILRQSKWLNAVSISATPQQIAEIVKLPFIKNVKLVQTLRQQTIEQIAPLSKSSKTAASSLNYGQSGNQVFLVNGQYLHNNGLVGDSMLIAVIDGGFSGADQLIPFDSLWARNGIIASYDFVDNDTDVYHLGGHGMSVLSVMAGYVDGQLIGTAPHAKYLLLKSENEASETTVEEDNWVAAAEFADSVGADIINSSLGYSTFDGGVGNYTPADLDGRTATTSLAAVMAARKGILVVNSAGNEGSASWQKITTPADADSILAVGAVDQFGHYVQFSSRGPSADGRVKPDIAAQGAGVYLSNSIGTVSPGNGTSFSAPIIAGLSACLWQKHPDATNMEIRNAIIESAHKYQSPDDQVGHGIPDFSIADAILSEPDVPTEPSEEILLMPNPFSNRLILFMRLESFPTKLEITVHDVLGNLIDNRTLSIQYRFTELPEYTVLPSGMYIFKLKYNGKMQQFKMLK